MIDKAESGSGKILFHVPNVAAIAVGRSHKSEEVIMSGLRWYVRVDRECSKQTDNVENLSVFLFCQTPLGAPPFDYFSSVTQRAAILSATGASLSKGNKFIVRSQGVYQGYGWFNFCKWADLINPSNKYVATDGSMLLESEWGYERYVLSRFDVPHALADAILIVGERRFHASKHFLACHSEFFRALFFGKFPDSTKDEIELHDTHEESFMELLRILHYPEHQATEKTVAGLLQLADRYDMDLVRTRCEAFLLDNFAQENVLPRLLYAVRYRLRQLRQKCINEMRNPCTLMKDVDKIKEVQSFDVNSLGEVTRIVAEEMWTKKRKADNTTDYERVPPKTNCLVSCFGCVRRIDQPVSSPVYK